MHTVAMAFPLQGLDFPGVGSLKNAFHPPQSHTQNPFQVRTELQFPFFISQGILFQSVPMLLARAQSPKPSSSRWTALGSPCHLGVCCTTAALVTVPLAQPLTSQ
uniref:Uncharacterized protein n=1 Tax=Panthera leo TaxID=9689 RepID=A0A8C8X3A2_PANLE